MAVRMCVHCSMPFQQKKQEETCPVCTQFGDTVFRRIKEYLYEHPGASATELVSELGVTMKQIRHYLREERLEVVGDGYTGLKCDACGTSIQTGRMCESCVKGAEQKKKAEASRAAKLASMRMKEEPPGGSGLRYQQKDDKGRNRKL